MDPFYKYFLFVSLMLFFIGFLIKNISTAIRTRQAIKGKSIRVNMIIVLTTLLYLLILKEVDLFFKVNWLDYETIRITGSIFIFISLILGFISLITMRDSWRVHTTRTKDRLDNKRGISI